MDGTRQRKEVYREKREKKNKVEEIQLANLASLGSLASNHVKAFVQFVGRPQLKNGNLWLKTRSCSAS